MGTVFKRLALCAVLVGLCVMPASARDVGSTFSAAGSTAGIPGELTGVLWDQISTNPECTAAGLVHCLYSVECTVLEQYTGIVAEDFIVDGAGWVLDGISVEGAWTAGAVGNLTANNWYIYADTGGSGPGDVVCDLSAQPTDPNTSDQFIVFDASTCPKLEAGTYWMGYNPDLDCGLGFWCWEGGDEVYTAEGIYVNDPGFCGPGWVLQGPACNEAVVGPPEVPSLCMAISGVANEVPETPATTTVGIGILLALMLAAGFYFLRRRQTA